jgi:hypothetical protein
MRVSAVVFGAMAIGFAVAIVWYFGPSARTLPSESGDRASRSPGAAETTADVPEPTLESAPDSRRSAPVAPATSPGQYIPPTREQMPRNSTEGERVFAAESVDATWAPGAEANILGRVSRVNGLALNAVQVECRSTMCKLHVAAPKSSSGGREPDLFDFFNNSLGIQPRWIQIVAGDSGMIQWVAYVGREKIPNATDAISAPR